MRGGWLGGPPAAPYNGAMITVYGLPISGHVHRVENLLGLLGVPFQRAEAPEAVRASPAFRALNPLGQIPVLEDGEVTLADSAAILVYLAQRYDPGQRWWSTDPVIAAQIQRWLSIAAGELRFGPARARLIVTFGQPGNLAEAQAIAARVVPFLDGHLATRRFLVADRPTLADLACYPYVATAEEGEVSLAGAPHVRAWLARLEAVPGWHAMPRTRAAGPR